MRRAILRRRSVAGKCGRVGRRPGSIHACPWMKMRPGDSATRANRGSTRIVVQPGAEPLFGFGDGLAFAGGVVGDLVPAKFADAEIF